MRTNIYRLTVGLAAILTVLLLADTGSAQPRETRGRMMTKDQVKEVIKRVEDRVDNFVKNLDRSLDHSRLNGTDKEDWMNKRAKDLEHATDDLRKHFDRTDAWVENKDEVFKCLNIATDIERYMRRYRFGPETESNWARVRYELNTLADVYNLGRVGANVYE